MPKEQVFDPFTTQGLLTIPELEDDESERWHGFQIDAHFSTGLLSLAEPPDAKLHDLRSTSLQLALDNVPLPEIASGDEVLSQDSRADDRHGIDPEGANLSEDEDIWQAPDIHKPAQENRLVSWDHFADADHQELEFVYISEAGNAAFDKFIDGFKSGVPPAETVRYAKPEALLSALFDLGLGRQSAFFRWNEDARRFVRAVSEYKLSGYSSKTLNLVVDDLLDIGTYVFSSRRFVQSRSRHRSVGVALARAVRDVLDTIEGYILESKFATQTLLRLQGLYSNPAIILRQVSSLTSNILNVRGSANVCETVLKWTENVTKEAPELEEIAGYIFARTIQPALQDLSARCGIFGHALAPHAPSEELTALLPDETLKLTEAIEDMWNLAQSSLSADDLTARRSDLEELSIGFEFSWEGIVSLQKAASEYEQTIRDSMSKDQSATTLDVSLRFKDDDDAKNNRFSQSPFIFDLQIFTGEGSSVISKRSSRNGKLQSSLENFLRQDADSPGSPTIACRPALTLSLAPLLTAQNRFLSYTVLRRLFLDHNVVGHLDILYRFHLITDGMFSSRLSVALFDSEQSGHAQGRASNARSGLRLQSRKIWPPASWEVRLVLMDLLHESVIDVRDESISQATSFAIRDLPDDQLERCRDIHSVHALDFLRLHYKSPHSILECVITSKVLKKYDRIFMLLLRLLRMKDLAQYLVMTACRRNAGDIAKHDHRFRLEIQQFMSVLANYSQNLVIKLVWHDFASKLSSIQQRLLENDYDGTLALIGSLDGLRRIHEDTLDQISYGLILKKKQEQAHSILESIFTIVLSFAARLNDVELQTTKNNDSNGNINAAKGTEKANLQGEFRRKVMALVQYLRTAVDQGDQGSELLEQLLLSIDFNGFYSKTRS